MKRLQVRFDFLKNFLCSHSYCRYFVFKGTPTYQLLHSSINDKIAVQAKHIKKVGIPVLLHRIIIKVSRNYIRKLDRTEKKHDSNFGNLRTKKSQFVSEKKGFVFSATVNVKRNAPEKFDYRYYCITMKVLQDYVT